MNSNRSRNRIRPALLALLLLPLALIAVASILSTPAQAQDVTGSLQGTVLSPEKAPEPDVHITVSGPHLQGVRGTMTDRHGFYQFLTLPPGTYELRIGRIGSRPIEVKGVVVELGRTTGVAPLTLTPQAIQLEPVEIVAPAVTLDPVHTTMGGVIKAEDYAALPVDRDYKSIISILPHANESYRGDQINVGGSTGNENQYYIDGVNATNTRYANRATSLPYNFVRSVNVRTGGYEARYGRALGAVVDAVTYSGSNKVETNVFGLTQPGTLAMDPRETPTVHEEDALYYEVGARVSGPLIRDRLWYSAALNPKVEKVDKEILGHGLYLDKTTATRFASKLTWRPSSVTNLELSVFGDPTTWDIVSSPPPGITTITSPDVLLGQRTRGGAVASLRATVAPTKSLLLEASLAGQWDRSRYTPSNPQEIYIDWIQGSIDGGPGSTGRDDNARTSLAARSSLILPRHTLVAGLDYEDLETTSEVKTSGVGTINRVDTATWMVNYQEYSGTFHNRSPAAYIQDTWQLTDRLALNAGLRWSSQNLIGASGNSAQRFEDEWQPRGGFSWQLGSAHTQRVFGSYGRIYQTIPTNIAVWQYVDYAYLLSYYSTDPRQPGAVADSVFDYSTKEADFANKTPGLEAENFDEFTLGYERLFGGGATLTLRGIRRNLRSSFQLGVDPSRPIIYVLGTPGKGDFDFLPPPKRQYTALEISAAGAGRRISYRASYVLSRSWGNYSGLYNSDMGGGAPGEVSTFEWAYQARNSTGFLPNDRTHTFKLSGAYAAPWGLACGAVATLESGAPINEFAAGAWGPYSPYFLVPRGTAGRTPALWDLDLRLAYDLAVLRAPKARIQLDVLHVGNPRRTTWVDETHYLSLDVDGNPATPNPQYKQPRAYQPPMAVRLGMEVSF